MTYVDFGDGLHICALEADNEVKCRGMNSYGQATVPSGLLAKDVGAGKTFSCAVTTTGGVRCRGQEWRGGEMTLPAGL